MQRANSPHTLATWVALVGLLAVGCSTETPNPTDPGPTNTAPVASAGADQTVSATLPVQLDGSASSDGDGDALTYAWTLSSVPPGSTASFDDATSATPNFTPDLPGTYSATLVVSDGTDDSPADAVAVTAEDRTTSETIGGAGGSIVSTDGLATLVVPAGALTGDESISMTQVPLNQRPPELADLPDDAIVYDFRPDGLIFDTPARLQFVVDPSARPTGSGETSEVGVHVVASLSDGTLSLASGQHNEIDPLDGTLRVGADVHHFSHFVSTPLVVSSPDGSPRWVQTWAKLPPIVDVGAEFEVELTVAMLSTVTAELAMQSRLAADVADQSSAPIQALTPFQEELAPSDDGFVLEAMNPYVCNDVGVWSWRSTIDVSVLDTHVLMAGLTTTGISESVDIPLAVGITCQAPPEPFTSFSLEAPESATWLSTGPTTRRSALYARKWGATMTDRNGGQPITFETGLTDEQLRMFRAAGIEESGIIVGSSNGLFITSADLTQPLATYPLDPMPPLTAPGGTSPEAGEQGPALAVPDVQSHTTDVFVAGNGAGGEQIVAVLHADKNIAFFHPKDGQPGFDVDTSLLEAFKDDNGSVFGTELPVTAWVGENGFTENDPMLVATIDETTAESSLYRAELVAGAAQLTEVDNLFPADEVRHLRCLDDICAIGAFGSGLGFGNLIVFSWDGGSTIEPVFGISGRTIGLDLIETESGTIRVATTSFSNGQYRVFEVDPVEGELLDSWFVDVPDGCTGPGHITFRNPTEVIITCNTSGDVVSATDFGSS